jgi:hypothetical protein
MLDILPFWSQGFGVAATRVGGKIVDLRNDLMYPRLLQIRDELIKLPDVLFGEKQIAAGLHPHLAYQLDHM